MPAKLIDPPLEDLDQLSTPLKAGVKEVVEYFEKYLGQNWEIYVQPHLNGFRPDLILLNPKVGVAVVEVVDWDLAAMEYAYVFGDRSEPKLKASREGEVIDLGRSDPVSKVETYKDAIFSFFCPRLDNQGYGCITGIIAFPDASRDDVKPILQPVREYFGHHEHWRQNTLLTLDDIYAGDKGLRHVLPVAYLSKDDRFSPDSASDLRHWLVEPEFDREQRRPLIQDLDARQQALVGSRTGSRYRKIRGAAGSGKSLVLAARAAALAREGKSVLIVTFNITLVNYLLDYVARAEPERKIREKIEAWNFHSWCRLLADKVGCRTEYGALWRDNNHRAVLETLLAESAIGWCNHLNEDERYDAILVDEGQDFQRDWWIALRSALTPSGEMLLVADRAQNIYGVENWLDADLRGTGLSSTWFELSASYRMPEALIDIAADFAGRYLPASEAIIPTPVNRGFAWTQDRLSWIQCEKADALEACMIGISEILFNNNNTISPADLTIITDDTSVGLMIEGALKKQLGIHCIHTLVSESDDEAQRNAESRRKKLAFFKGDRRAKLTTIQSFKGWESSVLVLYVSKAESLEQLSLVYTGMTRLKAVERGACLTVISSAASLESFGAGWPLFKRFNPSNAKLSLSN